SGLRELNGDEGPGGRELEHHARQDACADALVRAYRRRACRSFRVGGEVGLCGLEACDDALRVAEQELAGVRERDGTRSASARDEAVADDAFEGRDLLADGRLRVSDRVRGSSEGAFARYGLKRREMAQF